MTKLVVKLPFPFDRVWTLADAVQLGCLLEATAPKLGNVHPLASFRDMRFTHFLASAVALRESFACSPQSSVGQIILSCVQATQKSVGCNTNLGTVLLVAPLAKAHQSELEQPPTSRESTHDTAWRSKDRLAAAVRSTLANLTPLDSQLTYQAIRLAKPGGLGEAAHDDVGGKAPDDLIGAMQRAATVDAVARQYTNGFADILDRLVPWLMAALADSETCEPAIGWCQLRWLANEPDGLIVRKLGLPEALRIQTAAQNVLDKLQPHPQAWSAARDDPQSPLNELDRELRREHNLRNPGTTADLIAAALVCLLLGYRP